MKIRIKQNAKEIYLAGSTYNFSSYGFGRDWAAKMDAIAGTELEVETKYLFTDQYNTGPIKGVAKQGLRIMDEYVDEVIDDVRIGRGKCNWCGKHSVKSEKGCEHCEKGQEYMVWFNDERTKQYSIKSGQIFKDRGYDARGNPA